MSTEHAPPTRLPERSLLPVMAGMLCSLLAATLAYAVLLLGLYPPAIALLFASLAVPGVITALAVVLPLWGRVRKVGGGSRQRTWLLSLAGVAYLGVGAVWHVLVPSISFPWGYVAGAVVVALTFPSFAMHFEGRKTKAQGWLVALLLLMAVGLTDLIVRYL